MEENETKHPLDYSECLSINVLLSERVKDTRDGLAADGELVYAVDLVKMSHCSAKTKFRQPEYEKVSTKASLVCFLALFPALLIVGLR